MLIKYLVKDTKTEEIGYKELDQAFVEEILEKGRELNLLSEGTFVKASEDDLKLLTDQGLSELKESKIQEIKSKASTLIEQRYPLYKQNNIFMTEAKTSQAFKDMVTFISNVRDRSKQLEKQVQQCQNSPELDDVKIDFS